MNPFFGVNLGTSGMFVCTAAAAAAAAAAKSLQSCPTLFDPIDGSPPGPAVHFSHNKCWSFECVCFSLEVVMVSGVEDHAHHLSFYFKIWY